MKRALIFAVLASGYAAVLAVPAYATPVDGTLPLDGFAAMGVHEAGATLDPLGDTSVDFRSIARTWSGDGYGMTGAPPATFGQSPHGFAPPPDFESLLRDAAGDPLAATTGIERNPYFALGTWGGDGRDIVHHVIAADAGLHPSGYASMDYAVTLTFDGFGVGKGPHNDADDPPALFDGDPMFIPNQFSFVDSGNTPPGNNGAAGPGDTGSGGNGGGNAPSNSNGFVNGNPGGNGDPGGAGGIAGGGSDGGNGGQPCPVPEPSGLMLLLVIIPAVLLLNRPRILARMAVPAAIAAAALMFVPGSAKAQLHDWEQLCNGTGGVTPEVVVEGCSAVINADDESLNNVAIAYNNRGNARRALDRFDAAKADYDNAIVLAPSDPFPYRNRGVTYGLLGDYAHALADFNHAIALAPKYASAYLGRAFALEQLGNTRAAAADFARAKRLDPQLVAAVRGQQSAALPASMRR